MVEITGSCHRKKRYKYRSHAKDALTAGKRAGIHGKFHRVYQCPYCRWYHIGTNLSKMNHERKKKRIAKQKIRKANMRLIGRNIRWQRETNRACFRIALFADI